MPNPSLNERRPLKWVQSYEPVPYPEAQKIMSQKVRQIAEGQSDDFLWFLEHPPLLTRGGRSKKDHLLIPTRLPVFETDRGGELTYHGPGQRVVYFLINIRQRNEGDIRGFVRLVENCLIDALAFIGLEAHGDPERPGLWVKEERLTTVPAKIAFLGFRVSRGVTSHGISLNINPDLRNFDCIVPCGLENSPVTSLSELGLPTDFRLVDKALRKGFSKHLGPLEEADFKKFSS